MLYRVVEEWRSLPVAARRYIAYMALTTPVLFVWILVPYLMLATGISVAEAGILLSIASACASLLNYLVGRHLDYADPVKVIALIGVIEGLAYFAYYMGFALGSILVVLIAAIIERLARGLYVAFPVYEYDAYPEDRRERAFMLHNLVPYLVQLATYPAIGMAIASLNLEAQVSSLMAFATASIALGLLAIPMLPSFGKKELGTKSRGLGVSRRIPKGLWMMTLAIMLLGIGTELTPTLALTYLFMSISRSPLLSMALYESLAAIPMVIASIAMIEARVRRGSLLVLLGMSMLALGNAILGIATSPYLALSVALVESLGYALMDPFFMDVLFANIPKERRGEILGAIGGLRRILCIVGPATSGALASINPHLPFLIASSSIALATAITFREVRVREAMKHQ